LPGAHGTDFRENLAVMDISACQEIFGKHGFIDRIDITTDADSEELRSALPPTLEVTERAGRKTALKAMLYSFQLNLAAMSLLALFVGIFLIYNFSMFSVLSRREDMSLLLTLGADRRQLVGAFLGESLLLAAAGSLLGVGFGFVVAWLSIERVSSAISNLYFHLRAGGVALTWPVIRTGFCVGLAAALAGAAMPALEVAATPPIMGMKRRTIEDRAHGVKGLMLAAGLVCLAAALVAAWASRCSVFWGFLAAFGVAAGFALATPAFLSSFCHYAGIASKKTFGSLVGFLACRTIRASLSRTSVAVAALAIALSMTTGVDGMIHSFRQSVTRWLDGALMGDIYLSPSTTKWAHPLPEDLIEKLKTDPDVDAVERYSTHDERVNGRQVKLRIVDGDVLRGRSRFHFLARTNDPWTDLMRGGVFVSESLRYRQGLDLGGQAMLKTPDGDMPFPVVAVIRDYSADQGAMHIDRTLYERIWKDRRVQSIALFLKPGATQDPVLERIVRSRPELKGAIVSNAGMKQEIMAIFDQTFAPTATLKGVSLLVALLGVATALTAILMERSREMSVLGYLGLSPSESAAMNISQAMIMGLAAFLISAVCGVILTYVIVHAINYRSFGWSIDISFDGWIFVKTFLLTAAASLVSAVYPSLRLARFGTGRSLGEE
jgi:putative ABC transport system permease protein